MHALYAAGQEKSPEQVAREEHPTLSFQMIKGLPFEFHWYQFMVMFVYATLGPFFANVIALVRSRWQFDVVQAG